MVGANGGCCTWWTGVPLLGCARYDDEKSKPIRAPAGAVARFVACTASSIWINTEGAYRGWG